MAKVKIIADSTVDLTPALCEKYDIDIANLYVNLGDESFKASEVTPERLFEWSARNKATPKTSAITQHDCEEIFRPYIAAGREIVYISISSDMSVAGANAQNAAQAVAPDSIAVIDSQNLSTGGGHVALLAAELAEKGLCAKEIAAQLAPILPRVRASFVIDTTLYLYRGGRCSALTMLGATALSIKPSIVVEGGKMRPDIKYHGRLEKALLKYVDQLTPALLQADKKRVFITHSGCKPEIVEKVRAKLAALSHFHEILETRAGAVISSHCGPGTLGVLFIDGPVDFPS